MLRLALIGVLLLPSVASARGGRLRHFLQGNGPVRNALRLIVGRHQPAPAADVDVDADADADMAVETLPPPPPPVTTVVSNWSF